jgi:hypothetical protein
MKSSLTSIRHYTIYLENKIKIEIIVHINIITKKQKWNALSVYQKLPKSTVSLIAVIAIFKVVSNVIKNSLKHK